MLSHSRTWGEILALQVVLGSPVLFVFVALAAYYLRRVVRAAWIQIALAGMLLCLISVPTALAIWSVWPFSNVDITGLEVVNLPALLACIVLTPATIRTVSAVCNRSSDT